ncbi:UDP-N-acetylmuramate dehydrogenase [Flavicella sp.]|uniref:UDP-N-acetylmuramate dehydrogenase n=1 Tax=Flavicella sp. TaxID=2957742 RepID=UPI002636E6E5|nr:UDP-N-acetylmuramate dehydrogenase [Flavicella sp.]MDG1803589.1 UDP-N-acetylmuramate dehydrogenase [Flavicella sp.]
MQIQHNISLKNFNTFGIDAIAKQYIAVSSLAELQKVLNEHKDVFVLSGGSNLLLVNDIDKLVIHLNLKGISTEKSNNNQVLVAVSAGENWHDFVLWCIDHNLGGLENLSLIPGNVGTCPIQNIGAYGVEVKDTIDTVQAIEIETGEVRTFKNSECNFGYRNSVFKNSLKGKYIITKVTFLLTKESHQLNYSYGAIQTELEALNITAPTIKNISDAVIKIRNSKLPNPKEIGNSGSFFKNPIISLELFEKLKVIHPNMPSYPVNDHSVKIPAGWLIEQSGFKGKRFGQTGSHKNQALVLVNYGKATGLEIYALAKKIQATIFSNFEIALEIEVNVIE